MDIQDFATVQDAYDYMKGHVGYGDDEFAATRRAIVTAAATLAKDMK